MHLTAPFPAARTVAVVALSTLLAAVVSPVRAEPAVDDKAAVKARAQRIRDAAAADYKVERARCDAKQGNDKDVCIKVAKAFLADARAGADAKARAAR